MPTPPKKPDLAGFQEWLKSEHGKKQCRRLYAEHKAAEKQAAQVKPAKADGK